MIAAVIVTVAGFTSCAGGYKNMHNNELQEFILFKLTRELDLTDTQIESIKEITAQVKVKAEELHGDKEEMHAKIKELIMSNYVSEAEILGLMKSHTAQHEEMKIFIAKKIAEVHALLTPEQRIKLVHLLEKHVKEGHGMGKGCLD
jgi:Spy/CpxP family protein refolding chaperone